MFCVGDVVRFNITKEMKTDFVFAAIGNNEVRVRGHFFLSTTCIPVLAFRELLPSL